MNAERGARLVAWCFLPAAIYLLAPVIPTNITWNWNNYRYLASCFGYTGPPLYACTAIDVAITAWMIDAQFVRHRGFGPASTALGGLILGAHIAAIGSLAGGTMADPRVMLGLGGSFIPCVAGMILLAPSPWLSVWGQLLARAGALWFFCIGATILRLTCYAAWAYISLGDVIGFFGFAASGIVPAIIAAASTSDRTVASGAPGDVADEPSDAAVTPPLAAASHPRMSAFEREPG